MNARIRFPHRAPTLAVPFLALLVACSGTADDPAVTSSAGGAGTSSLGTGGGGGASASGGKGGSGGAGGSVPSVGTGGATAGKAGAAGTTSSQGGAAGVTGGAAGTTSAKGGGAGNPSPGKGGAAGAGSAGKAGTGAAGAGSGGSGTAGTGNAGMGTAGTGTAGAGAAGSGSGGSPTDLPGWKLAWADEFDGPDGSAVDAAKWSAEEGGDGWGNQEREYYTKSTDNARQEQGNLVIEARTDGASQHGCWYGPCQYTSARLVTAGKLEQAYGRFEARIQIPKGQGMWPAFWLLGNDIGPAGWPGCGETDIMENIGKEPGTVHGSLHGPGYVQGLTSSKSLPGGASLGDAFHVYAAEWEASEIRFYLDGAVYKTFTKGDLPAGTKWVFDHPNFILLNLAVGGQWPGDPDGATPFPQQMKVDYVRVYTKL